MYIGIIVDQDGGMGTRYIQAQAAFRQCTTAADRKFCAVNPPFGWGDGHMQDLMDQASAKECEGFGL